MNKNNSPLDDRGRNNTGTDHHLRGDPPLMVYIRGEPNGRKGEKETGERRKGEVAIW